MWAWTVPSSDTTRQFLCTQVAEGMGFTVLSKNSLFSSPHSLAELLEMTLCPKILKETNVSPKEGTTESQLFSYPQ